jgi:TPR repeat protein
MNRFERVSEPDEARKRRSLLRLARWLSTMCTVGILLACATAAVAILSDGNFSGSGKSAPQLKTTEAKAAAKAGGATIEANTTGASLELPVLPVLSAVAPVPFIETAASLPIVETAQANKPEASAKNPQEPSKPADGMPTLALDQVINCKPHQTAPFALSINADGVVPDHSLIAIHGLPNGTVLSAGRSNGAGGWILAPDDLGAGLSITLGDGPIGSSDLVVQLLTPEGRVARERHASLIISGGAKANESNELTPAEIQVLLSHGRDLQRVGYFAGARLFFQRAAEAGSAEAAHAMGETYDPVEFQKLGVQGLVPDEASARKWYDRARELEAKHLKQTGTAE